MDVSGAHLIFTGEVFEKKLLMARMLRLAVSVEVVVSNFMVISWEMPEVNGVLNGQIIVPNLMVNHHTFPFEWYLNAKRMKIAFVFRRGQKTFGQHKLKS